MDGLGLPLMTEETSKCRNWLKSPPQPHPRKARTSALPTWWKPNQSRIKALCELSQVGMLPRSKNHLVVNISCSKFSITWVCETHEELQTSSQWWTYCVGLSPWKYRSLQVFGIDASHPKMGRTRCSTSPLPGPEANSNLWKHQPRMRKQLIGGSLPPFWGPADY